MPLTVEDGTIVAGAESYITVAAANTYHANRGNATWTALTDEQCEQALRKATDYMVQVYRLRWAGYRKSASQTLDWPRTEVPREDYAYALTNGYTIISGDYYYSSSDVPAEVENACAELALLTLTTTLNPALGRRTTREKVDVIEVEYDKNSPLYVQFRAIDGMLAPFLSQQSGTFRTVTRT